MVVVGPELDWWEQEREPGKAWVLVAVSARDLILSITASIF